MSSEQNEPIFADMNNELGRDEQLDSYYKFEDMNIPHDILRGIYAFGFVRPSTIQQKGIVPLINRRDAIGQAQSGTGKTATFVIAALARLDVTAHKCQVLILTPTRELAQQIQTVIKKMGTYINPSCMCLVGGTQVRQEQQEIQRQQPQIVTATPGRVLDHIKRSVLDISFLQFFIIDEADEMFTVGFVEPVRNLINIIPQNAQMALFSATMPTGVIDLARSFLNNPVRILVTQSELSLDGISQFFVYVIREEYKFSTLLDLYETLTITHGIIYCNSKRKVMNLAEKLMRDDFSVGFIHGDLTESDRQKALKDFTSGATRILVTTDLLSRGIDIQQVSIVINYDLPNQKDTYIHRIGRSGRFGKKGLAVNFVTENELDELDELQKYYCTQIPELTLTAEVKALTESKTGE